MSPIPQQVRELPLGEINDILLLTTLGMMTLLFMLILVILCIQGHHLTMLHDRVMALSNRKGQGDLEAGIVENVNATKNKKLGDMKEDENEKGKGRLGQDDAVDLLSNEPKWDETANHVPRVGMYHHPLTYMEACRYTPSPALPGIYDPISTPQSHPFSATWGRHTTLNPFNGQVASYPNHYVDAMPRRADTTAANNYSSFNQHAFALSDFSQDDDDMSGGSVASTAMPSYIDFEGRYHSGSLDSLADLANHRDIITTVDDTYTADDMTARGVDNFGYNFPDGEHMAERSCLLD